VVEAGDQEAPRVVGGRGAGGARGEGVRRAGGGGGMNIRRIALREPLCGVSTRRSLGEFV
jgi:hypothetical protein